LTFAQEIERLGRMLAARGCGEFETEHRFHPVRRWRFDWAQPARKIAVEFEGGTWTGGRHTSGKGYAADLEKYNSAALLGWMVLRFTRDMLADGSAYAVIAQALDTARAREWIDAPVQRG
jgi:very-short-patch-repair endonuclease